MEWDWETERMWESPGEGMSRRGRGCTARVVSLFSMCWATEEYGAWHVRGGIQGGTYPHREESFRGEPLQQLGPTRSWANLLQLQLAGAVPAAVGLAVVMAVVRLAAAPGCAEWMACSCCSTR